jgi:hypothetical protein
MNIRFLKKEAMMPVIAGRTNIIKMIRTVSLLACVIEYGFKNKWIAHRMMHPTDATTPKRGYFDFDFDFNELPPSFAILSRMVFPFIPASKL